MQNFSLYKKTVKVILSLSILSSSLVGLSTPVVAANTETIPQAPLFCAAINNIGQKIQSDVSSAAATNSKSLLSTQNPSKRQTEITTTLSQKRTQWDADRAQQYEKMTDLATTDSQKQAIDIFKSSIETAVTVRRTSVDTAINTYFQSTSTALKIQDDQLAASKKNFVASVAIAINNAESDCKTGKNAEQIRSNLSSALANARNQLELTRKDLNNLENSLSTARKTEISSINSAVNSFNSSMSLARKTLIEQLKASGASDSLLDSSSK